MRTGCMFFKGCIVPFIFFYFKVWYKVNKNFTNFLLLSLLFVPTDPCDPAELVRLVPADEAPRWGPSAFSLSQQGSTQQPDQRWTQRQRLSLPVQQRQHAVRRRPWPGELLHSRHLAWLRRPLWTAGGTTRWGGDAPRHRSRCLSGHRGTRAGQNPGRGAVYCQTLPWPRRGQVHVQRVEICCVCHRQALSYGVLTLHHPLYHRDPHVST